MKLPKYLPVYIFILFLITLFLRIVLINYYNNNLGGIELNVVYGIQRLLLGQLLYQDPCTNTFAVIQYTPLYYHTIAALAKLSGIGSLDVQSIFVLCRFFALTCNLLTVGICIFSMTQMNFSLKQSIVLSLPVLMILTSHYYTRGDSMHLLFFTCTIGSYLLYQTRNSIVYLLTAALCTGLCLMVKQSGLLCLGIITSGLLIIDKKYILAAIYLIASLAIATITALLCIRDSSFHSMYINAWLGLKNGLDFSFLYLIFTSRYFLDLIPFYIVGGFIVYAAIFKTRDKLFRILAMGALLSWLFAVITGLKKGSSNNYFTEFLVFVLLSLPLFLRHAGLMKLQINLAGYMLPLRRLALIALFILVTSKTMGFFTAVYIEKGIKDYRKDYESEQVLYRYFKQTLKINPGEKIFFTERRFLDNLFIEYAIMPTKDVTSMVYLADTATYNFNTFVSGMNNGMIKYIVTDEKRDDINICHDSLPFVWFDKNKFRLIVRFEGYSIYQYSPAG